MGVEVQVKSHLIRHFEIFLLLSMQLVKSALLPETAFACTSAQYPRRRSSTRIMTFCQVIESKELYLQQKHLHQLQVKNITSYWLLPNWNQYLDKYETWNPQHVHAVKTWEMSDWERPCLKRVIQYSSVRLFYLGGRSAQSSIFDSYIPHQHCKIKS